MAILPIHGFIQETLAFVGWGSTPQTGSDVMAPFADWLISWKEGVPRPGPEKAPEGPKTFETGPGRIVRTRGHQRSHSQSLKAISPAKQNLLTFNIYCCQIANFYMNFTGLHI